jgi:hypothetical protein
MTSFSSLSYLTLSDNAISDITPFGTVDTLTELLLANNDINDLSPLSILGSLRTLDVSDNAIADPSPLGGLGCRGSSRPTTPSRALRPCNRSPACLGWKSQGTRSVT